MGATATRVAVAPARAGKKMKPARPSEFSHRETAQAFTSPNTHLPT